MNINETVNILKNQASTAVKEQLLEQSTQKSLAAETGADTDANGDDSAGAVADLSTGEEFDTFLILLTSQIKNQDPLAPLDSTQFVEQLATFSGLELQAKANNSLDRIEGLLAQQIAMLES